MFGAADGVLGEEWGVHGFASESGFDSCDGEVASLESGVGVKGSMFVKLGADLEYSGRFQ